MKVVAGAVRAIDRRRRRLYIDCKSGFERRFPPTGKGDFQGEAPNSGVDFQFENFQNPKNSSSGMPAAECSPSDAQRDSKSVFPKENTRDASLPEKSEGAAGLGLSEDTPFLCYEVLVLAGGMKDATLQTLGIRSWGAASSTAVAAACSSYSERTPATEGDTETFPASLRKIDGCLSAADPLLTSLLGEDGGSGSRRGLSERATSYD